MLKRVLQLHKDRRSVSASSSTLGGSEGAQDEHASSSESKRPKRGSAGNLYFRSPLTRLLAMQVGRGQSASLMQQVAGAAVKEAGASNVSESVSDASSEPVLARLESHVLINLSQVST